MSDQPNKEIPSSPELQPPDVREGLAQTDITHQGKKNPGARKGNEPQSYMGTNDEDVTIIEAPMAASSSSAWVTV